MTLSQSHGGSSCQARSVVDGLEAGVITMNQHNDIDILHTRGNLVPADWAKRLPNNASPTTSISVILVRKGNPKNIRACIVDEVFGGWTQAQKEHFNGGALYDQVIAAAKSR